MTENQEKQVFRILNNLVAGVNGIREDIVDIKAGIVDIKADIVDIRNVQADHGLALKRLETKTDAIALEVNDHGRRLDALERQKTDLIN